MPTTGHHNTLWQWSRMWTKIFLKEKSHKLQRFSCDTTVWEIYHFCSCRQWQRQEFYQGGWVTVVCLSMLHTCTAMTWRAKRTKNENSKIDVRAIMGPGSYILVDQLQATRQEWYQCTTIYVDHHSHLSFVHLQKNIIPRRLRRERLPMRNSAKHEGSRWGTIMQTRDS